MRDVANIDNNMVEHHGNDVTNNGKDIDNANIK